MDPLHFAIALGPLAIYLLAIGAVNLSRRARVTTGGRDAAALGAALAGFAVVGPMELFLPEQAVSRFGAYVWLMLLILYALGVTLLALLLRPRLVVYNATVAQLRPVLEKVIAAAKWECRWGDETLVLPQLGVSLCFESSPNQRHVQLASVGPRQNYAGWRILEKALAAELRHTIASPNPYGGVLLVFGLAMAALVVWQTFGQPQAVADALREMLRL